MPASMQRSRRRRASSTSVLPHAEKNSPVPPNVAAPKLRAETLRPEPGRMRYSMRLGMQGGARGCGKMPDQQDSSGAEPFRLEKCPKHFRAAAEMAAKSNPIAAAEPV